MEISNQPSTATSNVQEAAFYGNGPAPSTSQKTSKLALLVLFGSAAIALTAGALLAKGKVPVSAASVSGLSLAAVAFVATVLSMLSAPSTRYPEDTDESVEGDDALIDIDLSSDEIVPESTTPDPSVDSDSSSSEELQRHLESLAKFLEQDDNDTGTTDQGA